MARQTYGHYNEYCPDVMTESLQLVDTKLNYDSRYRSIVAHLDVMIASLRHQPGRKLTTELDRLLDGMMHHIGSENRFMKLVDYPQATEHRKHHYHIFVMTDDLNRRFAMGQNVLPEELDSIRLLWLIHIQMHDQAFEEFLTS